MNEDGPSRGLPGKGDGVEPTSGSASVEAALKLAIDLHGPGLLNRPQKLRLHLDAQCSGAASDIGFLMAALDEGVPQALLDLTSTAQMQAVTGQLQEMLAERRGLNPFAASWAVATWAAAVRMDLFGPSTRVDDAESGLPASTGLTGSDPPQRIVPAAALPFSVPFGRLGPSASASPTPVSTPTPAAPEAPSPETHVVPAVATDEATSPPVVAPATPDEAVASTREQADVDVTVTPASTSEPAIAIPMPAAEATGLPQATEPLVPTPSPVDEESLPRWAADAVPPPPQVPTRQRFGAAWAIAGLLAAIAVAIAAMRAMSPSGDAPPSAPVVADAPPSTQASAPSAASSTAPQPVAASPVAAPAPAPPSIIDVAADGPLLGDGRRHDVFVTIDPARRDVKSVEATFMAGDGPPEPRSRVIEVPAVQDGRIAVGSIGLRTATPATSTFQYVLVGNDGQRSTPFVKQFAFAPVATRPSAIDDIVAPVGVVAGSPFTLTIHVKPGESGIAAVERSTVGTDAPPRKTLMAGLARPDDGTLRYPVEALASASPTTFAFTLIDQDGSRSEAKRIVVEPATPKRNAADGTTASRPAPFVCARATCGSVVSVREIDRSKTFEVLARMDDRSIHTVVSSAVWKVGMRVRRNGNGFAALQAAAPAALARPPTTRRAPLPVPPESPPIVDR